MGVRPTCVELATWCGLCFGHLWFQSAFCRLYLKQLDTMGRQRLPWIIFSILLLIHFEGKLKFLMGGRPTCVELATWCGLCFGHLWF